MNKGEMLRLMQEEYERLEQLLAGLSEAQMTAPLLDEGWSIKDTLQHFLDWQKITLESVALQLRGIEPAEFRPGYPALGPDRQKIIQQLNTDMRNQSKNRPLADVLSDFRATQAQYVGQAKTLSEADLFDASRFPWRKGRPLADSIREDADEHYADHRGWMEAALRGATLSE